MPNLAVISLNAGLLTPLTDARSDIEKYSSGCRILSNMIPRIYGPVERRPGTKYIADAASHSVKSRMVEFIFSATVAYKLEFSDQTIKVYYEQTLITSVESPYLEADLFQLQFEQFADVMWIVHPSYAPRKLSRTTTTTFTLEEIVFDKGPFIKRNDLANDDDVTIAVTGYSVATASTSGGVGTDNFTIEGAGENEAAVIGAMFTANTRFYITGSTGNDGAYTVHATTTTTVSGTTVTIYANESIDDGTDDGQVLVSGGAVTFTSSSGIFEAGHVGALFKITHNRLKVITKGSKVAHATGVIGEAIDVKGNWTAITGGNWSGTIEIQRLEDGTNWETFTPFVSTLARGQGSDNLKKVDTEEGDNVQYRLNVTEHGYYALDAHLKVNTSTQDSIFRITAVASATSATATAIIAAPDNVAAKRWAEGSWSSVRGYPSAVTFFEERIVYGFTDLDQQDIWFSETGEFEDFEAGTKDADSFAITVPTANRGRWLGALESLAVGTSGDEWRIRSTAIDEALTPTNFSIKKQTSHGSADIQAMKVNDAILFIDYVARKVREFTYVDDRQKYVAPDLTALAEDITSGGITSAAVQKNPDSIIWFTTANSPYLISMTYEREQDVVAFATHPLGGDGVAESVCVTPSTDEDIITLTARWEIEGETKRYILDMQPRDWGSVTSAADSFFVDAGIIDISETTAISGLGHLEGKEVTVLVDGAVQASKTVSDGSITIDEAGDRVVVGLPYIYQASPMRPDMATGQGTSHGSTMFVPEIVLSLYASDGVEYGDGTNQKRIDFRTTEGWGASTTLFTGDTRALHPDGGFNNDMDIVISGSEPLPCTLRAIILRTKKTGR